ncbi:MAG: hypothetical protein ACKVU2_01405 [Saprospiraceae bacterium]
MKKTSSHPFGIAALTTAVAFLFFLVPAKAQIVPVKVIIGAIPVPSGNMVRDDCKLLEVVLQKQNTGRGPCCYKILLNNKLPTGAKLNPAAFQVSIKNGNITDVYAASNTWQQTPAAVPPKAKLVKWSHTTFKIPPGQTPVATICVEGLTPAWLQYTWLDRTGAVLCRDSVQLADCVNEQTDLCDNPLIQNSGFAPGPTSAPPANWSVGYGSPVFSGSPSSGFMDVGHLEASGNQTQGSAITQVLAPTKRIYRGKKYLLSAAVRFLANQNTSNYARLRAVAFNGTLPNTGSMHPAPGPNIAIIGRSGKIKDCGDWMLVEFFVWTANKDFQNIALNVFTDDGATAKLLIDNVSLCEVSYSDCDETRLDAAGKPVLPIGYQAPPAGFPCTPGEELDEYNNGSLQDLYGGPPYNYTGTTDWYANAGDKCFSIGGTIPAYVENYNCDDSLRQAGLNIPCDSLNRWLQDPNVDAFTIPKPVPLQPIGPVSLPPCHPPNFQEGNWAFKGKDIIYIHGLELGHVVKRIVPTAAWPGALANWPYDPQEFYGSGFYKKAAIKTWKDHIEYFTNNQNNPANNYRNRYFVVAYNCSQRLDIAVHSVLTQIREAMENGTDVVYDTAGDSRKTRCFGREYVIISQSTGAMVADVLLAIANDTKTDPAMAAKYGNIGYIADRCVGHIARRGAFTGSDLATILVALTQPVPGATAIATGLVLQNGDSFADLANPNNHSVIRSSILVDLIPKIARDKWGPYMDRVPVKVLTVAGGHPTFLSQKELSLGGAVYAAAPAIGSVMGVGGGAIPTIIAQILKVALTFKYIVHPGFDDGVITTDCANGRKSTFLNPSTFQPTKRIKVFDMGIETPRAASYFLDQLKRGTTSTFCTGATPYLSPTGMVQPVSSYSLNQSYRNHFTFVQAAGEHWIKKDLTSCDYRTTAIGGSSNYEEQLVVNNSSLFATGIIHPGIVSHMGETIKGLTIPIFYIKIKRVKGFPYPVVCSRPYYIWKRTYHNLQSGCLLDCDYAYRYLFKN